MAEEENEYISVVQAVKLILKISDERTTNQTLILNLATPLVCVSLSVQPISSGFESL
jgi:hypothetical protein